MRTITIPKGATLSGLARQYNTNVNELMGLNPTIKDPDKIFAGATLNLPTLAGTLDKGGGIEVPDETKQRTLPKQPTDRLAMFRDVLKMVTQRALKESVGRGGEALPEGMLKPEQVSGGTFADIIGFATRQKSRGIADIYKSTVDMMDKQQKQVNDQLSMLISTGAIANLDDDTLRKLAGSAHIPFDYLKEVREVRKPTSDKWADFTDLEKRKLEQAGINWMTQEGYQKALDLLYGEQEGQSAEKDMKSKLMSVRGDDDYISPESYKEAKNAWHHAGLSRKKFDEHFEMFVNPEHVEDYGLEGV